MFVNINLVRFATFWERAALLVDLIFSLYFDYLLFLYTCISRFGFQGGVWVLIGSSS